MEAAQAEIYIQESEASGPGAAWVAIGASVQGTSHLQSSLPCQDYLAYRFVSPDILVAAVADGLGSEPRSRQGACLACETSLAFLGSGLKQAIPADPEAWIQLLQQAMILSRQTLEETAEREQADLREYGATLLLNVIAGEWLAAAHIGDGASVAWLEDGSLLTICMPQTGEYINETYPLTMPNAIEMAVFSVTRQPVKALALMTDGMCHISLRRPDLSPHPPFFQPLFQQLPTVVDSLAASQKLAAFMQSERVCSMTDDDKTLVLIGRRPA